MVVIVHQAPGMAEPAEPLDRRTERIDEDLPIGVVADDLCALVAAAGHMIERARKLDAERSRHATIMGEEYSTFKTRSHNV